VDLEVVVSNNCTAGAALILNGGIWVKGNVTDLLLGNIENQGQSIVIYASSDATPRRTVITESRTPSKTTTIQRQCRKLISTPGALCDNGGTFWNLDPDRLPNNQTFSNVFSPDPATDYGLIFVTGNIGSSGTLNGLRRGISVNTTSGVGDTAYAIYQNTGLTTANKEDGTRLTVVADGNIFITGQLNYRIDPRGSDGEFSEPIPGDGDDQLDVQNVLGIFSWGLGMAGGVQLSSALTGNVDTHGLIFAANASGNAGPSGQFSFEDPDGSPRGESRVLGGVVQKTMGQFGQPSSNSGYERNWFYDERFRYRAVSPPKLPLVESFTAATTLGIDSYTWRLGLFNWAGESMLRWINLALAVVLAGLLLSELTRARQPAPSGPSVSEGRPVVAEEQPGRRSRRIEQRLAIEEARRQQRERRRALSGGPPALDSSGHPIRDWRVRADFAGRPW
jgi:hypothetical protein